MPLPASYSEVSFADFLVSQITKVAAMLGWDAGSVEVIEAVNDALLQFGTTDISAITSASDLLTLRLLGQRAALEAAKRATDVNYSVTDNAQRLERQQVNQNIRDTLKDVQAKCDALGIGAAAGGLSIGRLTLDFIEPASEWA